MSAPAEVRHRPMPKGRFWDDFRVGEVLRHKYGRTVTRAEAAAFATQTMDRNPLHFNLEYARAHGHPDLVVSEWFVFHLALGMTVEDVSEHATALLGYGDVTFHRPVYPDDTLTAESTVLELRPSGSKPDQGIIRTRVACHNRRGETVVTFERTNLIKRRSTDGAPSAAAAQAATQPRSADTSSSAAAAHGAARPRGGA